MQAFYDLPAPAKLNLFLHITGRRADGYHLLQSVFMLIDWADSLDVVLRSDGVISRIDIADDAASCAETTALPADDLCVRAARMLQIASGVSLGAQIVLRKRIPTQAGMGGGSSDAATCLLALNRLWGLNWPLDQLQTLGLQLGADVPFFLHGSNAWVEGVGEQVTDVELAPAQFVVLKPKLGSSTQAIFSHPSLKRDSPRAIISGFVADPYGFGQNDLQPVVQTINPQVTLALHALSSQGLVPRMTGSGSAVFAKINDLDKIVSRHFDGHLSVPTDWRQKQCSSLSAHPLKGWAI